MSWTDLGDDELFARLTQRGMQPEMARGLIDGRDDEDGARWIEEALEGDGRP